MPGKLPGKRTLSITAVVLLLAMFGATLCVRRARAEAQESASRLAVGKGEGTLKVGSEKFKINSVIVKLIDDRKAEITLVSDITVFLTATWTSHADSQQEFDLDVSSDSRGGVEGKGKVILSGDGKAVTKLSLKGISRGTKRSVEASFEGK
jgi:hypothetical protein